MTTPVPVSGQELSARFYEQVVAPLLEDPGAVPAVEELIERTLPDAVDGWPVRFGWDGVPPRHHVEVSTPAAWLVGHLGVDATGDLPTREWLLIPQQQLLGVVSGRVHSDGPGVLTEVRGRLRWYPDEVWRWLLASQWHRLAQEEAFVARTAEVGDDLGSRLVAARLVRDAQRLVLLQQRTYAPYGKWLGTAFSRAHHRDQLPGALAAAVSADARSAREDALARVWEALAHRQNGLGLHPEVAVRIGPYHGRPAQVLMADRFTDALLAGLRDPGLRGLAPIGAVDQVVDTVDVLTDPARCRGLAGLYEA